MTERITACNLVVRIWGGLLDPNGLGPGSCGQRKGEIQPKSGARPGPPGFGAVLVSPAGRGPPGNEGSWLDG